MAQPSAKPAATPAPPEPGKEAPAPVPLTVTNVKPRLIEIATVKIGPGATVEIPLEHAEGVRASAVFKAGFLVEGRAALPASTPIDITRLDEDKAKKLIAVEDDLSVLSAWSDVEKRPAILSALQERVKQL